MEENQSVTTSLRERSEQVPDGPQSASSAEALNVMWMNFRMEWPMNFESLL